MKVNHIQSPDVHVGRRERALGPETGPRAISEVSPDYHLEGISRLQPRHLYCILTWILILVAWYVYEDMLRLVWRRSAPHAVLLLSGFRMLLWLIVAQHFRSSTCED